MSIGWFWNIWQKSVDRVKGFVKTTFYMSTKTFTGVALVFEKFVVFLFFLGVWANKFHFLLLKMVAGLSKRHQQAQRMNLRKKFFLKKIHFFWLFEFLSKILGGVVETALTCLEGVFEEGKVSFRNFSYFFTVFQWSVFESSTENFGGVPEFEIHGSSGRFEWDNYQKKLYFDICSRISRNWLWSAC